MSLTDIGLKVIGTF